MNENNARLIQHLTTNNSPPPATSASEVAEQSRRSHQSSDQDSQSCHSASQGHSARSRRQSTSEETKGRERSPRQDDLRYKHRDKSTTQKIKDLNAQIDTINTCTNAPITVDSLIKQTEPPFTDRKMRVKVSSKFKLPSQLGVYEGKTDPMDHLDSYKNLMSLQGYSNKVICKAFSATLKGIRQKNASYLFTIHQKYGESLKDYVKRFNQAVIEVEDPSDKSKTDKYIAVEELAEAKLRRQGRDGHKRKEPNTQRTDYKDKEKSKRTDQDTRRRTND
ncbi:hypothetical protein Acr_10g0010760 [Actinidia rufa]|uniref:Retrotransposon gag domain-containing protein n=1 Tax=Actinidia rufa TaxID=165716 RepID=A0A7J0FAK9_9ERIC|nr:hypothetical protein Acr_10g0010760 [Actinidia rufa]